MIEARTNELGQPIGPSLAAWIPPPRPPRTPMFGSYCRLEPLDLERHAVDLFEANALDTEGRMWTYLAYGPFDTLADYQVWVAAMSKSEDPQFFAVIDAASGKPTGVASYLRIRSAERIH